MNEIVVRKSAEDQFKEWIESLLPYEKVWYINKIAAACDMSYQGVYKWSIGKTRIKAPFIEKINLVAGKEIIKM